MDEDWVDIQDFETYKVSTHGRVVHTTSGRFVSQTIVHSGAVKVNLSHEGQRVSRLVSSLVAEAFIKCEIDEFDTPMHLNMDYQDNHVWNLVWRPRFFVWKYARQYREPTPHFTRGPVLDITQDMEYDTFGTAALTNGILVRDIWSSVLTKKPTFPTWQIFEFL